MRDALDAWIDATRRGDIPAQMAFYPEVVPVYYRWRNASSTSVLAEKQKVFGEARVLDIRTGQPEIEETNGTAVARFRKTYVIEGPRVRRRGEVLQELRWIRTEDGWKIASERDAAVLASHSPGGRAPVAVRGAGHAGQPFASRERVIDTCARDQVMCATPSGRMIRNGGQADAGRSP